MATTSLPVVPRGFVFGVATSGFQIEGGFNGPGEPANNWAAWERDGHVEPSGIALDFWRRYEHHLERAAALGIDSLRLSIEWARCEPAEGDIDGSALGHYATILDCCIELGLEPLVTLNHFSHPEWLGQDFWLDPDAPRRYAEWVGVAVDALGSRCSRWVTLNEINVLAEQSYLTGAYPPGRRGEPRSASRALDHLLTAHVLGYEAIHRRQERAVVTTNNSSSSIYERDALLTDVLCSRSLGVARSDLGEWLLERRRVYYDRIARGRAPAVKELLLRRLVARIIPLEEAFPDAVAAVYGSPHERALDIVGLDYYDPLAAHAIRLPGHRTAGGRCWEPERQIWDVPPDPSGLVSYAAAAADRGLGVWVVENGIANRVRRGRSYPRRDGWDRIRYLRDHLGAIAAALRAGIPIVGYWHWTLADNYEWGSYEPRLGLYGVDRERGLVWRDVDSMGCASASAYRSMIGALREGDHDLDAGSASARRPRP